MESPCAPVAHKDSPNTNIPHARVEERSGPSTVRLPAVYLADEPWGDFCRSSALMRWESLVPLIMVVRSQPDRCAFPLGFRVLWGQHSGPADFVQVRAPSSQRSFA